MSDWTHPICEDCWKWALGQHREPPDRVPMRVRIPVTEVCCWCGLPTTSGIYVREDPATLPGHTLNRR